MFSVSALLALFFPEYANIGCYRDIVDVKHIETEVRGMMIGPLTRSNDDIPAG